MTTATWLRKPAAPSRSARPPVQRQGDGGPAPDAIHAAAREGAQTASSALPYAAQIQRAFGRHDISGVQAHTGSEATASAHAMDAAAYATGNHVVFAGQPSLHTVAHEAAHVVQQRAGVQLLGGVGQVGDVYERNADAVAARVVAGRSAEDLLTPFAGGGSAADGAVQSKAVQRVKSRYHARQPQATVRPGGPHKTQITHRKGTFRWVERVRNQLKRKQETVGVAMEAKLEPSDPKKGSGTDSGVQADLMGYMRRKYGGRKLVKGHLLNDHLGGLAIAENLYPITYSANSIHKNQVEAHVKDLVREESRGAGRAVYYTVTVDRSAGNGPDDAAFDCTVSVGTESNMVLRKRIISTPGEPTKGAYEVDSNTDEDREDGLTFHNRDLPKGWGQAGRGMGGHTYGLNRSRILDRQWNTHAKIR